MDCLMKRRFQAGAIVGTCFVFSIVAFGEASGDRPDARHAWSVHDVNRPDPVAISAEDGRPPSDAIVLFDGTAECIAANWQSKNGQPTKWKTENGRFVCVPGSGPAVSKRKFGDIQLHVEWQSPENKGKGNGNSGVILMGLYEIQILNSYGIIPSKSPWKMANYADGQAGAVYGQSPCLVNPARPTGVWQTFDIVFHPPVWEKEELIDPGDVTVFYNGVLVQDHWQLEGATWWCRRARQCRVGSAGPIQLQDHGNPVPFRNIWVREIPSRHANTTCGGPYVKESDVMALRGRLADETRVAAETTDDLAEKMIQYWSSFAYRSDAGVRKQAGLKTAEYMRTIAKWDAATCKNQFKRLEDVQRFMDMLANSGFLPKEHPVRAEIKAALARGR